MGTKGLTWFMRLWYGGVTCNAESIFHLPTHTVTPVRRDIWFLSEVAFTATNPLILGVLLLRCTWWCAPTAALATNRHSSLREWMVNWGGSTGAWSLAHEDERTPKAKAGRDGVGPGPWLAGPGLTHPTKKRSALSCPSPVQIPSADVSNLEPAYRPCHSPDTVVLSLLPGNTTHEFECSWCPILNPIFIRSKKIEILEGKEPWESSTVQPKERVFGFTPLCLTTGFVSYTIFGSHNTYSFGPCLLPS